jgi:transposase
MILDLKNLPIDTKLLHQIITDLVEKVTSLEDQLALLKAKRFGKSSEKLDKQINDLEHQIEESESLVALAGLIPDKDEDNEEGIARGGGLDEEPSSQTQEKNRPKRKKLPEHLERTDEISNPDPKCPTCDSESFRKISDDISETLEYIPSSFKVIRHIRPRCVCINCETIVQAYPSSKAIDKGKAGPGLLAHILVQKYCNHLPLYRQSQIYEREGIDLSRSTMASWAGQCAILLQPLIEELKKAVFGGSQIHGDDTTVKVLAPGLGQTKTGRIWTYVRDGRPHGDTTTPPAVCYFYSPDRKGERPEAHLKDFTGVLHADAYSGYDKLYYTTITTTDKDGKKVSQTKESNITEAACWAHTRRKFYEVTQVSDKATIANETLERMASIYHIEEEIRGQLPEARLKERQARSKALVEELFTFWQRAIPKLPQKSQTAKAIAYAMNNKTALMRFLSNGKIEIDNNAAERSMRSIALGRKNYLFAGSDRGGETAANIYSLIETAKLNNINPWSYLNYVLKNIQDHNSTKLADLLPWNVQLAA